MRRAAERSQAELRVQDGAAATQPLLELRGRSVTNTLIVEAASVTARTRSLESNVMPLSRNAHEPHLRLHCIQRTSM